MLVRDLRSVGTVRSLALLLTAAALVCLIPPASAQSELATVFGRVTDQSGAVVADAEVEIKNVETRVSVVRTTNSDGLYSIPALHPGHYVISIRKQGFKTVSVTDLTLNVQDNVVRNFQLEIGSMSESITVTAESERVNTTDATVSTVVDRQFVENMPLNGRSFQTLINLTPGVVTTAANYNQEGQFSVNGQRPDANYFTVDGVSANVGTSIALGVRQDAAGSVPGYSALGGTNTFVSVDAMQEFRIQTSTFAPEFGRTPGAQVSIITRSGTGQFHGTAFDYFRNDVLDANDWFANANHQPKPQERQNDFGGVLGGPLIGHNTFFFFSYEGLRLHLPQAVESTVPSIALRQSAPAAIQPLLNAFPLPNGPDLSSGVSQFTGSFSDPSSIDSTSLRVDHTFNSKLSAFARYSYAQSDVVSRAWQGIPFNVLSNPSTLKETIQTITVGLTQAFSNTVTNEIRFNYSHNRSRNDISLDSFGGATPPDPTLLFPSFATPADSTFGAFFLDYGAWDFGKLAENLQRQLNIVDNVSVAKGGHQLKFGIDYRRLTPVSQPLAYQLQPDFFGQADITSGVPSETDLAASAPSVGLVVTNFSTYAQDTWRAGSRLSLTYGLRWDINPPFHGNGVALPALAGANTPSTFDVAPAGTPIFNTTYGNLSPRLGIAYRLSQRDDWATIIRAGFGIFYDLGGGYLGTVSSGAPFFAQSSLFGVPFPPPADQETPPPLSLTPPISRFTGAIPNLQLPRTYQWSAALEQSIGTRQSVTATYIGAAGRQLLHEEQFFAPSPTFGSGLVFLTTNAASSDYHALQLQFKRSLASGLQVLASYTWSHSIDNASDDSNNSFGATVPVGGVYDPRLDRGPSDFDIRHSGSIAISYEVPKARVGSVGGAILNNWAVDTLFLARSAPPVDLVGKFGFAPPIYGNLRPDVVPDQPFYLFGDYPGGKALNPAAFTAPPGAQQGTLPRNALRGFGAWQQDLAIRRAFKLSEKISLQFRAEAFNLFNHPNFSPPANNISSAFFGQSIEMLNHGLGGGGLAGGSSPLYQIGGPRSGQLALKLQF